MKPHSGNKFKVIGTMSGTSLDGLDIAAVEFEKNSEKWSFEIIAAETFQYSKDWESKLRSAPNLSGEKLINLHTDFGLLIGNETQKFIIKNKLSPNLIASHGHTIFHQPENGFTFQAGDGNSIAAVTKIATVADFRSKDVALGGQGAPLVPAGDRLLFSEYHYCLNLGGFANISFKQENQTIAYDICPVNFILNFFAEKQGLAFDKDGLLGRKGTVKKEMLEKLNRLPFYSDLPPKSLGREWMEQQFMPAVDSTSFSDEDKLRTVYEHIAFQISRNVSDDGKMLVTGGGAFNAFLIERIKQHTKADVVIPAKKIVNYKEALIFAFLGLLRYLNEINCYASVTGARKDSSTGTLFLP